MLASSFELSSLLAENGGDGSAGFVATTAGNTVAVGDVNGDEIDDLILADPDKNLVGSWQVTEGAVYVVYGVDGTTSGFPASVDLDSLDGSNGFAIHGNPLEASNAGGKTGYGGVRPGFFSLGAGDVNGDGYDDIVIPVTDLWDDPENPVFGFGTTYVVFGGESDAFGAVFELASINGDNGFAISAPDRDSGVTTISAGDDVNSDGISDIVFGLSAADPDANRIDAGQTYVVYGRDYAANDLFPLNFELIDLLPENGGNGSRGFVINGANSGDASGIALSSGGDLNADGFADLVIGARRADPNGDRSGQTYVLFGSSSAYPPIVELSNLLPENGGNGSEGFVINGIAELDGAGGFVSSRGDLNGDGINDLAIGAPWADPNGDESGQCYVLFGKDTDTNDDGSIDNPFPTIFELSSLASGNGSEGFVINGSDPFDRAGRAVSLSGDVNDDDFDDLVVAAPGGWPGSEDDPGEVYVIYGTSNEFPAIVELSTLSSNRGFVIEGVNPGDAVGFSGSGLNVTNTIALGDLNGDNFDDIAIASGNAGATYVVFGGSEIVPPPQPGITVEPTSQLETTEGGGTDFFSVVLDAQPTADVTIGISSSDLSEGTVSVASLLFTTANWSTPQTVTITGVDDSDSDGDVAYTIHTGPVTGAAEYAGIDPADVSVTNLDNDTVPVAIYVYDISFESKRGNKDWRAVFEIHTDSGDVAPGVAVEVTFAGQTYTGITDADGIFRTGWIKNLGSGDHYANAVDLVLANYVWDPLMDLEDDTDGDGFPDDVLSI